MTKDASKPANSQGRSSHEERGLKWWLFLLGVSELRRSSHEERGLKFMAVEVHRPQNLVAPRMRSVD